MNHERVERKGLSTAAASRAAWAERRFETAAADYVRIHLGTGIRPTEHEKQDLHALKADHLNNFRLAKAVSA